jgi:hypothetical protein
MACKAPGKVADARQLLLELKRYGEAKHLISLAEKGLQ